MSGRRLGVVLFSIFLGFVTVLVLVGAGAFFVAKGMAENAAGPTRWQPITPTPTLPPTPTVAALTPTPVPEGIYVGGQAEVVSGVGVRMRRTPGYKNKPAGDVIVVVPPQSVMDVVGGPREVDGLRWWRVRWQGKEGWMAEYSARGLQLLAPAGEG